MSIYGHIDYWVKQGELFELTPALGGPTVRRMIVHSGINALIVGPWPSADAAIRCGRLQQDLDIFVEGRLIQVAARPFRGKTSYMLRLDPEENEVWEIRSRDPEPQIRVFGRFADQDVFVALFWELRSDLGNRGDGSWPDIWREVGIQCMTEWNNLFRPYPSHSGSNFPYDYITNAVLV